MEGADESIFQLNRTISDLEELNSSPRPTRVSETSVVRLRVRLRFRISSVQHIKERFTEDKIGEGGHKSFAYCT